MPNTAAVLAARANVIDDETPGLQAGLGSGRAAEIEFLTKPKGRRSLRVPTSTHSMNRHIFREFPVVNMSTRLGCPVGAGVSTELCYRSGSGATRGYQTAESSF